MPFVAQALAGAIVLAFLPAQLALSEDERWLLILQYGVLPVRFEAANTLTDAFLPMLTHVFLHGGWLHLAMNMIAFLQGGPFVAARLGPVRFLILFFASAIGGALAYVFINSDGQTPMVGASGAICGVFAAYFLAVRPTPQAALADPQVRNAIGSFLLINVVLMAFLPLPIAWEAHLGGFVTGGLLYLVIAPRFQHGPWG